jgi:hypothetical protein
LEQYENEEYFETLKVMQDFSRDMMKIEVVNRNTDYVSRFDTRCGRLLILVTLTTLKKLQIFRNTRNLSGSKIRIGYCLAQLRRAKGDVYFVLHVKGCGHRACLRRSQVIVDGSSCNLNCTKHNI